MSVIIRLNGVDVSDRIDEASISMDMDSIHDTISVSSSDLTLWDAAAPSESARIQADFGGGTTISYILEERSGSESGFSFGGRALSALEEEEYAGRVSVGPYSSAPLASVVAAAMLTTRTLSWQIGAYTLPAAYAFSGPPIQGVAEIAAVFGAVVRCDDSGRVVVMARRPGMYPPWTGSAWPQGSAAETLDAADEILEDPSYSEEIGDSANAVVVDGASEQATPEIEQETQSPEIGDPVHLRVYWPNGEDMEDVRTVVSAGACMRVGSVGTMLTERITFQDYVGETSHPIAAINSISYIGESGGVVTWSAGQKTMKITERCAVADVIYNTSYQRFLVSTSGVDQVVVGFAAEAAEVAPTRYMIGSAVVDEVPERIQDANLIDSDGKRSRAAAVLAEHRTRRKISVECALSSGTIRPGMILSLSAAIFGTGGLFWADRVNIALGLRESYQLELVQCRA